MLKQGCISMVALVAITSLLPDASAQSPASSTADAFVARNPGAWRVVTDPITANPSFVYGARLAPAVAPRTPAQFEAAARVLIDENPELFANPSSDFGTARVHTLSLSRIGSSDKVAVILRQEIDGLSVFGGVVTVLFERESGDVIAIDDLAVPYARNASAVPKSSPDEVLAAAGAGFAAAFGFAHSKVIGMEPAIVGASPFFGKKSPLVGRGAALAYLVDLAAPAHLGPNGAPAQARVFVSAEGDLTVFKVEETAHTIGGNARTNVNLGPEPNTTTNQEQPTLRYAYVRSGTSTAGSILATTDVLGNYTTAGSGPQTVSMRFEGPFCRTDNTAGSEHVVTLSNATTPADFLMNPSLAEFTTAESAAFFHVNEFRDYVRRIDPGDATMDFQVLARVNANDLLCNAYFDGGSITLEREGGGCTNTSYQDVVQHEEGHYAIQTYNGSATGAFHEGIADVFAYFINDDPCLSHFNFGNGCLRTATQTAVKKCPNDGDETCNGGASHTEGQAIASACWAVRTMLDNTHGNTLGDLIADTLFMGWMNAFDDGAILDVVQDHWLALDDDNANLADLTPHFADITGGFGSYNWGFPAPTIAVTQAPAPNAEIGHLQPVMIRATINTPGVLTVARIDYVTSTGTFSVNMLPTGNPSEYSGTIPGLASPASVSWTLTAVNQGGGTATWYHTAPGVPGFYHVGTMVPLAFFDFEGGSDQGWTHVNLSGSNGDQWQRGNPSGSNAASDPNAAFSGASVWGTDLSLSGTDGMYEQDSSGELRSPSFNLLGQSKVFLQYRRWLAVEEGIFDQAQIRVNGSVVWANPQSGHVIDEQWITHDLDITSLAANNSSVQISYRLTSDGGLEFGGWNIDDFLIYRLDPSPAGFFATYGAGCVGSAGTPSLAGSGTPTAGQMVTATIAGGVPNGSGLLMIGAAQASIPVSGCTLLVAGLVSGGFFVPLGPGGGQSLPATLPPGVGMGDIYMQFFSIDPAAPNFQFANSNGLQMHVQ